MKSQRKQKISVKDLRARKDVKGGTSHITNNGKGTNTTHLPSGNGKGTDTGGITLYGIRLNHNETLVTA